jgi:CO/xanthine dehydrogenase Mo-binding subunit
VAAAVANAVYNASGVRVRDYPFALDKLIERMPGIG